MLRARRRPIHRPSLEGPWRCASDGPLALTSPGDPEKEKGDKRFPKGSGNSKVDELHNLNDRKYRDKHHQWNHDRDEAEPDQPPPTA